MRRKSRHIAGWLGVIVVVLIADFTGEQTMSDAFLDMSHRPVGRPALVLTWTILTAHLFGIVPPERDPVRVAFIRIRALMHSNATAE